MKNLEAIKQRYIKEPFGRRIGHLASNLAKVCSFLENSGNSKAVEDILEESKFFIEWTVKDAPFKIQVLFSDMQPKLALWQRCLSNKNIENAQQIKKAAKIWSEQLIKISGLIAA